MNTLADSLNIIFFTNDTSSRYWRIDGIANWLNNFTKSSCYITSHKSWNGNLPEETDIVVIELLTSPALVDRCHELGAKVIYEADDAFLDSYGKERKNLDHISDKHRQETIETINKCDAITVTTEVLKNNYARFTDRPIYVLPNFVDLGWYGDGNIDIKRTTDEIRIGWFGSRGHLEDLQTVIPALNKVLEKYQNAKFIYCGFGGMSSDRMVTSVGWGEDIFKDIPRERREYVVGVSGDMWTMKHRFMDLDIGIAPLIDDYFNRCKTPIKWMEYAMLETPSVCSPTLYSDIVKDGIDGFIACNTEEWVEKISKLIENEKLRKKMGREAHNKVLKRYNLEQHKHKWLDVYMEVYGRR